MCRMGRRRKERYLGAGIAAPEGSNQDSPDSERACYQLHQTDIACRLLAYDLEAAIEVLLVRDPAGDRRQRRAPRNARVEELVHPHRLDDG